VELIASIFSIEEYDKQETKMKHLESRALLHAGLLLDLLFDPEYGGDIFLRNFG
jgi:hypothetical protein